MQGKSETTFAPFDEAVLRANRVRREPFLRVMQAALRAVDPRRAVRRTLRREGGLLYVADRAYALGEGRVVVVGAGKASGAMAAVVEDLLGARVTGGAVVVKYGHTVPTRQVVLHEAGHPLPDEAGVTGTARVLSGLRDLTADDLVLCLLSGGGSALLVQPAGGISLADVQATNDLLIRSGATIREINAVRKHLSQVKGGQLVRVAAPARVVSLILSDVVGSPLDVIASGPTVPDPTTFVDAGDVLRRYGLTALIPAAVRRHLERGLAGTIPDTPKPGDAQFERSQTVIVGSNEVAARAAVEQAQAEGFHSLLLSTFVEGEAREVAKVLAAVAREMRHSGQPVSAPACLVAGGETTVTVHGEGKGGRNQELALAAAIQIAGLDDVTIVSLATDGTDGPTDVAGALADGTTVDRGRALGLNEREHLADNNAYSYFGVLGDLLITGPTLTNVNDLVFVFVGAPRV